MGSAPAGPGRRPLHAGAAARTVSLRSRLRPRHHVVQDRRLRDALTVLDGIRPGDPLRPQADELRTTIQQKLLEAARATRGQPPSAVH